MDISKRIVLNAQILKTLPVKRRDEFNVQFNLVQEGSVTTFLAKFKNQQVAASFLDAMEHVL
jgi:hypothetical protein